MGITVIASAKLAAAGSTAANAANAASAAGDGGGTPFSSLLGLQLANPQALNLQLSGSLATGGKGKDATSDDGTVQDPASLLAAAGLLPGLPANPGQNLPASTRSGNDDALRAVIGKAGDASGKPALPQGGNALLETKADAGEAGKPDALAAAQSDSRLSDAANIAADDKNGANASSSFAAALAAQTAAPSAQPHIETAAAAPQVSVPLQDSRWAQDFSDKVVWLAKNDQQTAQIAINPPQLGPVHITLNISGDQASAVFASPHAEVRQAIQDAMPELRAMLAGAGIDLGQANVGAQLPQQQQQQQNGGTPQQFSDSRRFGDEGAILHGDSGLGVVTSSQAVRGGRGMVDLFA